MKKSGIVIIILSILLVIFLGVLVYGVFQGVKVKEVITQLQSTNGELESRNAQLEEDRSQMSKDKEKTILQLDECRNQSQLEHARLQMLMEDWSKIQKSCVSDNVCSGKFPYMRYQCNVQGDAVDNGDKVCECDQDCELIVY